MKLKTTQLVMAIITVLMLLMVPLVSTTAADELKIVLGGSDSISRDISPIEGGDNGIQIMTVRNAGALEDELTVWPRDIIDNKGTGIECEPEPSGISQFEQYLETGIIFDTPTTIVTNIITTPANTTIPTTITTAPETMTTTAPGTEVEYVEIIMPDGSVTVITCDMENRVVRDFEITSASGLLSFTCHAGTRIITPDGKSPHRVVITEILGKNTSGWAIRIYEANGYDSNGSEVNTSFNPPVLLTFHYLPDELPDNATGAYVALYDELTDTWARLESPPGYTPQSGELGALITHISIYGIFADFTPSSSPGGPSTATIIWIIIGGLLVIFLLVLLCVIIHRRHKKTDIG